MKKLCGTILAAVALFTYGGEVFSRCDNSSVGASATETSFWQRQIDDVAEKGGGVVTVPVGRHLVGQLDMRSNVELHLEDGAVLEGLPGLENYRVTELPYSEGTWSAIVFAVGVTNVAITGRGEINGNGQLWKQPPPSYPVGQEGLRARGVFFADCKGIRLEDFAIRDAACWGVVFKCCDGVVVRRVKIDSHANVNNDGFDVEARNVLIEDCDVDTGDDAFCVKSNNPDFTVENVVFRNCTGRSHSNVCKIGTATRGTVRNVRFENIRCEPARRDFVDMRDGSANRGRKFFSVRPKFPDSPEGIGLSMAAIENVDGGCVEDIVVDGLSGHGYHVPLFVRGGKRPTLNRLPHGNQYVFRNVSIRNVRAKGSCATANSVSGVARMPIENVVLENIDIVCLGAGTELSERARMMAVPDVSERYPECLMFKPSLLPAYGLYVDYVDGIRLANVSFRLADGMEDSRPPVFFTENVCVNPEYDVAAYVWPAYQPEPRWAELGIFGDGIGEWQNVKEAVPKWDGHCQPLVPLWGYENEADPKVVEKKIDVAVSHGVNVFIYDWYWYGGRPFLEDALDKGFLGAPNNGKMKFFVMWANHHVDWLWDNKAADKRRGSPRWRGWVGADEFRKISDRWIAKYFSRPNYYRIGGKPVLMIFEVGTFVEGLGGTEKAAAALADFRERCEKAGLGGVHVMACDYRLSREMVKALGIDSATIYNMVHWSNPRGNPDYSEWAEKGARRFDAARKVLGVPAYFAHASVGWDTNPRYPPSSVQPTVLGSTPEKFEAALRRAKDWCDRNTPDGMPKLITVNSWNEWTEGSYLEPDTHFKFGYLEAVKRVFTHPGD